MDQHNPDPFMTAFGGRFFSVLRWEQLDELWERLRKDAAKGWYIYVIGDPPPVEPVSAELMRTFLSEVGQLLRKEHHEEYCGIVYTDSFEHPEFVKIFDPHNLGVSCGFSDRPPLPGWILSRLPPVDLKSSAPLAGSRRRWWQRLLGT
jgi:hypothetical protein